MGDVPKYVVIISISGSLTLTKKNSLIKAHLKAFVKTFTVLSFPKKEGQLLKLVKSFCQQTAGCKLFSIYKNNSIILKAFVRRFRNFH